MPQARLPKWSTTSKLHRSAHPDPSYVGFSAAQISRFYGLGGMTLASHARGRGFESRWNYFLLFLVACSVFIVLLMCERVLLRASCLTALGFHVTHAFPVDVVVCRLSCLSVPPVLRGSWRRRKDAKCPPALRLTCPTCRLASMSSSPVRFPRPFGTPCCNALHVPVWCCVASLRCLPVHHDWQQPEEECAPARGGWPVAKALQTGLGQ